MDFTLTYSFRPYHSPGVDSAPNETKCQEHLLVVKRAGAWGWPHHLHVPNVMEIWEPKPYLEPSGPHRAYYGIRLLFCLIYIYIYTYTCTHTYTQMYTYILMILVVKTWQKEASWTHSWEDNIKTDLKGTGRTAWTGFIWFRVGTRDELLFTRLWNLRFQ